MDDLAQHIVTPFGHSAFVQDGIAITPLKGLRDRFTKLAEADSSVKDLNPEECYVLLKRRMTRR